MLTTDQVKKIAKLANLSLTDSEIEKFQTQLSESLDYVAILDSLDTTNQPVTNQVTGKENVTREDKIKTSLPQAEILDQAKETKDDYFKVKNIFD